MPDQIGPSALRREMVAVSCKSFGLLARLHAMKVQRWLLQRRLDALG